MLWLTPIDDTPLILKIMESVLMLMFKPGYTVEVGAGAGYTKRRSMTGIN